jgi:predicted PurR-regulated permease PerM
VNEAGATRVLYRYALFSIAIAVLVVLAVVLRWVLIEIFVSVLIAAGMAPLVRHLTGQEILGRWKWHPSRGLVVLLIYSAGALILLILGTLVLGSLAESANSLDAQLPGFETEIRSWTTALVERLPVLSGLLPSGSADAGSGQLGQLTAEGLSGLSNIAANLGDVLGGIITIVFILFMALYMTIDGERMRDYTLMFVPRSRQPLARRLVTNISYRLGHWVSAQLLLCLIIGTGATLGFAVLGVPGAPILGLIWALAEFVPGIGPFIAAVPSILMGFLAGPTVGVWAALFTFVWSQVESNYITPRVMGRALELSPLVVLMALLVGNELFGLAGALISIPLTAACAVVVDEIYQVRVRQFRAAEQADIGQ